jgi:hypothetical protein
VQDGNADPLCGRKTGQNGNVDPLCAREAGQNGNADLLCAWKSVHDGNADFLCAWKTKQDGNVCLLCAWKTMQDGNVTRARRSLKECLKREYTALYASACQISAYAHYARTPALQLKQRTDDIPFWVCTVLSLF